MQNVRSLKDVILIHKTNATTVIGTILNAWCSDSFPQLVQSSLPVRIRLKSDSRVKTFLLFLKGQPLLDSMYWLSSAYALLGESSYRKSLAMYFTPPLLIERLLTDLECQGVEYDNGKFFDPACGGAAFLAPIAMRMKAALKDRSVSPRKIIEHVENNLFGMDLDSTLCVVSHQFLKMALYEEIRIAKREPSFNVMTGDSLCDLEPFYDSIDILVCNPPYRKANREEIEKYRHNFGEVIEGQPNLYGLFITLCIKLLKQESVCALVTPTSFLSGQYFSKLRGFLMKETQILNIGMVTDRSGVFIDVLQETALTILQRNEKERSSETNTVVSVVSGDGNYTNVGPCMLPNSGASWPIPRVETDILLIKQLGGSEFRIKDYGYTVRIGTFVWNRDLRPVYMSADEVSQEKTKTAVPLLWSSDIKSDGRLHFDGADKGNGEPCFVDFGDRSHCSVIQRASVLLQRVTSNDQKRRLVASVVPKKLIDKYGGFVGENHTVILEQVVAKPMLTPKQMAKLLGGNMIDRYFRCISGATNVSAFELKQLPLPDPILLKSCLVKEKCMETASRLAIFGDDESDKFMNELKH